MRRRLLSLLLATLFLASACTAEAFPGAEAPEKPVELSAGKAALTGEEQAGSPALDGTDEPSPEEPASAGETEEEPAASPPALTLEQLRQAYIWEDVPADSQYLDAINYAAHKGILQGVGEGLFAPDALLTRAQTVTVLWRMSGLEPVSGLQHFSDVSSDSWYAQAVAWGEESGVVTGTEAGTFLPEELVTREQLAVMLLRYARHKDLQINSVTGDLSGYQDGAEASAYAVDGLSWALGSGIYNTLVSSHIHPGIALNRGQLSQVLTGFLATQGEALAQAVFSGCRVAADATLSQEGHEAIQLAVDAAGQKYGAAGIQVAVIHSGQVVDSFACGWATKSQSRSYYNTTGDYTLVKWGDPMTADHKLRVASLSKVVVGMGAMCLAEEGVVDLEGSIGDAWGFQVKNPYYPNIPVSIRSILSHTSSIYLAGDDVSRAYSAVKSGLSRGSVFSRVQPGSIYSWGYNNYAFGVLGMTLELAAGEVMDHILDRRFFDAMDIDAAFESGSIEQVDKLVTIYQHDGSVGRSLETSRSLVLDPTPGSTGRYFAGGLTISAKDMGKLVCLLANHGTYEGLRLLSAESVSTMESIQGAPYQQGFYQALPLRYQEDIYGRAGLYYHTGSAYGVYNCLSYDPATGDGVVVLTTGASAAKDGNGIYAVCGEISQVVYQVMAEGGKGA